MRSAANVVVVVVPLLALFLCSCEQPPAAGCAPACAAREPACEQCPAIVDELCIDGACAARGDDVVDLSIDVSLDRDLLGVAALAVAVVDARIAGCDDVGAVKDADNVLAGNLFSVAGGSFHPDLRVGLVPAGDVVVAVDALDADNALLQSGCVVVADDAVDVLVTVP